MSLEDLRNRLLSVADTAIKFARDLNVPSAEVFVINQSLTTVSDNNGKIDSRDGIVQGAGIRVAVGKQLGFASCTGFENDAIKSAIEQAHKVAKRSSENPMFPGFIPDVKPAKEGILDPEILNLDAEILSKEFDIISEGVDRTDQRIVSFSMGLGCTWQGYAIATTEGCLASSLLTTYSGNAQTVVMGEGDRKAAFDFKSNREITGLEGIGKKAVEEGLKGLGSKPFEGTEVLPTIWGPREVGGFITDALRVRMLGSAYVEQSNPWKDSLDQEVASKDLTLIDEGQNPEYPATQAIDAEGTPKGSTALIEKGILKNFLFNRMFAHAAGKETTGNCQRGGGIFGGGVPFEIAPTIGPNKILVDNISKSLDEQIAELDKGILITGQPIGLFVSSNPITGDFSVTSNESFLIEKGEISHPLKTVGVAGNYIESLLNPMFIGSDRDKTFWPVDSPTITFPKHTITS
jgi:PmbA protein